MLDEKLHGPELPGRLPTESREPDATARTDSAASPLPFRGAGPIAPWSTRRLLTVPGLSLGRTGKL